MPLSVGLILLFASTVLATAVNEGSVNDNDISTCSYDLVFRGCSIGENQEPTSQTPPSNDEDDDGGDDDKDTSPTSATHRLIDQIFTRANNSAPSQLLHHIIESHVSSSVERKLTKLMEGFQHKLSRMLRKMECCGGGSEKSNYSSTSTSPKPAQNAGVCPEGFEGFERWVSCYKFSTFNTTWHQAMEYCFAMGGNLVQIGTTREHYILSFLLNNNQDFGDVTGWWTSGHYFVRIKKWAWASMVKNDPFRFKNWPNEAPMPQEDSCMYLDKTHDYQWGSDHCHLRKNFICEVASKSGWTGRSNSFVPPLR